MKILLLIATMAMVGCASDNYGHLLTPQLAQAQQIVTNQVTQTNLVTVTNQVVQTVTLTNGVTVTETNQVTQTNVVKELVPVLVTNTVTVTNGWQVSSTTSNVLADAGLVNSVTAPLNPYSGLVSTLLGAAGVGLSWFARLKTKQAQQHLSTASTIITAVEGLAPAVSAGVKTAIADQALKMGTADNVQATVQAVTQSLPAAAVTAPASTT